MVPPPPPPRPPPPSQPQRHRRLRHHRRRRRHHRHRQLGLQDDAKRINAWHNICVISDLALFCWIVQQHCVIQDFEVSRIL